MFDAKARKVGSSFGFLIPKEVVDKEKIKEGVTFKVSIFRKDLRVLKNLIGSVPNLKYERDHNDRF